MAENIINKDLVTLYRGQPMFGPSRYLQMANQGTPTIMGGSTQGLTTNQLSKLAGQYYTTDLPVAEKYAGKTGKILSTQVPSNYVNESGRFNRFQNKVTGLPSGNYTNAGVSGNSYLVPKSTLKNYPSKINIGKTISNYMGNLDYPGKVIKAGYDLGQYGPGGVLKEIGSEGLGFLKNNAIKGLTTLGSLPVQAALMTLNSTPANASEVNMGPKDFAALNADLVSPSLGSLGDMEEEDEFADIRGQTAGLGIVSGLKGLGLLGDYFINQGRAKIANRGLDFALKNTEQKQIREAAEAAAAARVAAVADINRNLNLGGYQSDFAQDDDFMSGSGTAAEMGSFRDGGLASMFVRRG